MTKEVLGTVVHEEEKWGILADGKVMDIDKYSENCVSALSKRIDRDMQSTRRFMDDNGWLLVRVQTSHQITGVLKTLAAERKTNQ